MLSSPNADWFWDPAYLNASRHDNGCGEPGGPFDFCKSAFGDSEPAVFRQRGTFAVIARVMKDLQTRESATGSRKHCDNLAPAWRPVTRGEAVHSVQVPPTLPPPPLRPESTTDISTTKFNQGRCCAILQTFVSAHIGFWKTTLRT